NTMVTANYGVCRPGAKENETGFGLSPQHVDWTKRARRKAPEHLRLWLGRLNIHTHTDRWLRDNHQFWPRLWGVMAMVQRGNLPLPEQSRASDRVHASNIQPRGGILRHWYSSIGLD